MTPLPDTVPAARAVLAGTVETAVNALWDAAPVVGDRIAVVGGGMVGCCVARLLTSLPGARVELVDADPERATVAEALGVAFRAPADASGECDLVVHATGHPEGLDAGVDAARRRGRGDRAVSWYGDRLVPVPLGEAFHSRRLTVRASQVGASRPGEGRAARTPTAWRWRSTCWPIRRSTR